MRWHYWPRGRSAPPRTRRGRLTLRLERLEDRTVPSYLFQTIEDPLGVQGTPCDEPSLPCPWTALLTNLSAVDAPPHSPFAALLWSPRPFRAEVSGRAIAQPVRRCMTHLLPVRPTSVGRTDLTSHGAPKRFSSGNPVEGVSNGLATRVSMPCRVRSPLRWTRDPEASVPFRQVFGRAAKASS